MPVRHCDDERGFAILFLAIAVVVLMGMIGLPIDSGMLATTASQYRHTAEYAVTSGLEAYLSSTANTNQGKLQEAVDRARVVIERDPNIRSSLGRWFFLDPAAVRDDVRRNGLGAGQNGVLIPGTWDSTTRTFSPVADSVKASALKIQLKHSDASPLKPIFMRLLGRATTSFQVSAIAVTGPVHVVTIVDLSSYSTGDNYWKSPLTLPDGTAVPRSEYALRMTSDCSSSLQSENVSPTGDRFWFGRQNSQEIYNALPPGPRPGVAPLVPIARQFQSDYPVPSSCQLQEWYDATKGVGAPGQMYGYLLNQATVPEPLQSYLSSVHEIMNVMDSRNTDGDLFGFIGADNYIHRPRVLPLTIPDLSIGAFNGWHGATAPYNPGGGDTPAAWSTRIGSKFLFPYSRHFDLGYSLTQARQMLEAAHTPGVRDIVILYTTGMSSCHSGNSCPNANEKAWADGYYTTSMTEAFNELPNYVMNTTTGVPISLNIVMGGNGEGASTLIRRKQWTDAAGRTTYCMPDWLARRYQTGISNNGFVDDTWNPGTSSFFYPALGLYSFAAQTKGTYYPLRPCCSLTGCSCMTPTDVASIDFQGRCQAAGADLSLVSNLGNVELNKFLDNSRLLCDPFGRTKTQQANAAINDIVRKSPIILVTE
ncbi:MAG: hypothetical protein IT290_04695 [Deltaproteobacteria bacterium]|nr:hypothetical protein [Deltaproteobacteria bacterium]